MADTQKHQYAVKALIVKEDKILIVKRSADDTITPSAWEFPGGRLDLDEKPIDGLKREVFEETNLLIDVIEKINTQEFTNTDGIDITMYIYLCRPLSEGITLSEEHAEMEWIPELECTAKLTKYFHEEVKIYLKSKE